MMKFFCRSAFLILVIIASSVVAADQRTAPQSGDPRDPVASANFPTPGTSSRTAGPLGTENQSPQAAPSAGSPPTSPVVQTVIPSNLPAPATQAADACSQDIPKTCSGLQWGEGMALCLKKNQPKLSAGCQTKVSALAERHDKFAAVRNVCKLDRTRFCPDVKPGQGRVLGCLKENEAKVSVVCRRELQTLNQG